MAVGDPITVRGQITGRGTFDSLRFPEQSNWREFKVYPATSHSEAGDDLGVTGTNNFEQVVVPQNAEIKTLPGLEFCFFDPEAGQYRVLRSPSFPITVRASAATPQPTLAGNAGSGTEPPPANEIVHIKPDLGLVAPVAPPLVLRGWFWGLQTAFPLIWAGLALWRRREEKLAANPRLQRRKQVDRLVREMMTELGLDPNKEEDRAKFITRRPGIRLPSTPRHFEFCRNGWVKGSICRPGPLRRR